MGFPVDVWKFQYYYTLTEPTTRQTDTRTGDEKMKTATQNETRFDAFATREELKSAYARHLSLNGVEDAAVEMLATNGTKYTPHLYRGGWVVRGFGFSVERIGKFIPADRAGRPELV